MSSSKKLFLSAVSSEFGSYRRLVAGDLKCPNLDVAEHEDIKRLVIGGSTLKKPDKRLSAGHCQDGSNQPYQGAIRKRVIDANLVGCMAPAIS